MKQTPVLVRLMLSVELGGHENDHLLSGLNPLLKQPHGSVDCLPLKISVLSLASRVGFLRSQHNHHIE